MSVEGFSVAGLDFNPGRRTGADDNPVGPDGAGDVDRTDAEESPCALRFVTLLRF